VQFPNSTRASGPNLSASRRTNEFASKRLALDNSTLDRCRKHFGVRARLTNINLACLKRAVARAGAIVCLLTKK
jgi:hypothetical protein